MLVYQEKVELINWRDIIMDGKLLLFLTTLSVVSILFLTMSVIKFLTYRNRRQSNQWDKTECDKTEWDKTVEKHVNNYLEKKTLPLELRKQLAELNDLKGIMSEKEFKIQKKMLLDKF